MEIRFLNIDLDIESSVDISPIIEEWGESVCVFRNENLDGIYYGSFETSCLDVSSIIDEYVSLVKKLSPESRKIWDNALKRDFDFGYESGSKPTNYHSRIEAEYIKQLSEIGGCIVISIYPLSNT